MELDGKCAIVTGGGTGVGRATALRLAQSGCSVLVNYSRSQSEAEQTAAEAQAHGVKAIAFKADVADDAACRSMAQKAAEEFGGLQILINNAGTTSFIPHNELDRVKDEDWDRILAVNVKGPFQCSRAAVGAIRESGGGEIVNVASVAGVMGVGSSIPYCASKAALINMTMTLARALGPDIRVNAVAPGFITGRWLREGLNEDQYEAAMKFSANRSPLNKVCDPEDVAAAIIGLLTGSDMCTGQTIVCDGGMLLGKF